MLPRRWCRPRPHPSGDAHALLCLGDRVLPADPVPCERSGGSEKVWPIISNTALAVSEAYFGHSGTQFKESEEKVVLTDAAIDADPDDELVPVSVSAGQYFYKPMSSDGSKTAVLAMNAGDATASMEIDFSDVPGLKGTKFTVRDIHAHKDLGSFTGKWTGEVDSHDVFLLTAARQRTSSHVCRIESKILDNRGGKITV